MLTQCPNCRKAIVIQEPGIHDCPRCKARIWIYPPGDDKADRVIMSPETMQTIRRKEPYARPPSEIEAEHMLKSNEGEWTPPWEERERHGFWTALQATWKLSAFQPTLFFTQLKTDAPFRGGVIYGWIFLTLGYMFWAIYRLLFMPIIIEASRQATGAETLPSEIDFHLMILVVLIGAPLISLVTIYLNAGLYHAVLCLIGSSRAGLRGTLRVVVYSSSAMIFTALPFFGDFIAFVWSMVVGIIGLARVHHISNARAMLAVLLPPITFYLLFLVGARLAEGFSGAPFVLP